MAQVMDSYILQSSLLANDQPRRVQAGNARARLAPGKDPGVVNLAGQRGQNPSCCRRQRDGTGSRLGIAQAKLVVFEVDMLPS